MPLPIINRGNREKGKPQTALCKPAQSAPSRGGRLPSGQQESTDQPGPGWDAHVRASIVIVSILTFFGCSLRNQGLLPPFPVAPSLVWTHATQNPCKAFLFSWNPTSVAWVRPLFLEGSWNDCGRLVFVGTFPRQMATQPNNSGERCRNELWSR